MEIESDSTNNIDVFNSDNNILVTTPAGSLGSLGSHKILGTPPSKLKDTKLSSNLYFIPSSGQSERSVSEVSNRITNLDNLGSFKIIII